MTLVYLFLYIGIVATIIIFLITTLALFLVGVVWDRHPIANQFQYYIPELLRVQLHNVQFRQIGKSDFSERSGLHRRIIGIPNVAVKNDGKGKERAVCKVVHECGHSYYRDCLTVQLYITLCFAVLACAVLPDISVNIRQSLIDIDNLKAFIVDLNILMGFLWLALMVRLFALLRRREFRADNFAFNWLGENYKSFLRHQATKERFCKKPTLLLKIWSAVTHPSFQSRYMKLGKFGVSKREAFLDGFSWSIVFFVAFSFLIWPLSQTMFESIFGDLRFANSVSDPFLQNWLLNNPVFENTLLFVIFVTTMIGTFLFFSLFPTLFREKIIYDSTCMTAIAFGLGVAIGLTVISVVFIASTSEYILDPHKVATLFACMVMYFGLLIIFAFLSTRLSHQFILSNAFFAALMLVIVFHIYAKIIGISNSRSISDVFIRQSMFLFAFFIVIDLMREIIVPRLVKRKNHVSTVIRDKRF